MTSQRFCSCLATLLAFAIPQGASALQSRPVVWELPLAVDIYDLVVSETGITYILTQFPREVRAFDLDGDLLWTHVPVGVAEAITVHRSGEISVGGYILSNDDAIPGPIGGADGMLQRLDPDGTVIGAWRVGGTDDDFIHSLRAAGEDLTFTGESESPGFGYPDSSRGATYGRIDFGGNIVWVERYVALPGATVRLHDIAMRADGTGSAVGYYFGSGQFERDRFWIEFDASGVATLDFRGYSAWDFVTHLADGAPVMSGFYADGSLHLGYACREGSSPWCVQGAGTFASYSYVGRPLLLGDNEVVLAATDDPEFGVGGRTGLRRVDASTGADMDFVEIAFDDLHIARVNHSDIDPRGGVRAQAHRVLASDITSLHGSSLLRVAALDPFATVTCPGEPNSVGPGAVLDAAGSDERADDELTLFVNGLPPQQTVLFITSRSGGFTPMVGGGQGTLCLGGTIGRFAGPGMIRTASPEGRAALHIDLSTMPIGPGGTNVLAGETWLFQSWYRDTNPGSTSNMSSAISVTFQ